MRATRSRPRWLRGILLVGILVLELAGSTSGPMNVSETYYLKVTNGTDNAYLRIRAVSTGKALPAQAPVLISAADAIIDSVEPDKAVLLSFESWSSASNRH